MKYELTGRIVFEAEDIDDAFKLLAAHFKALSEGRESDLPLVGTNVKVKAVGIKTPVPPAVTRKTTLRGSKKS